MTLITNPILQPPINLISTILLLQTPSLLTTYLLIFTLSSTFYKLIIHLLYISLTFSPIITNIKFRTFHFLVQLSHLVLQLLVVLTIFLNQLISIYCLFIVIIFAIDIRVIQFWYFWLFLCCHIFLSSIKIIITSIIIMITITITIIKPTIMIFITNISTIIFTIYSIPISIIIT